MTPHQPLHSKEAFLAATAEKARKHLIWEFRDMLRRNNITQEAVAPVLGVKNQAAVSKWVTSNRMLPEKVVKRLDDGIEVEGQQVDSAPVIGLTWKQMRAYCIRGGGARGRSTTEARHYDVFLASPMAAANGADGYQRERQAAVGLKSALETYCEMSVYYAGRSLPTPGEFEANDEAAEMNFRALTNCDYFVLLMTAALSTPSSVFVEAGWALAQRIPSLYLVPEPGVLPFCLQHLNQQRAPDVLPPVLLYHPADPAHFIEKQGRSVFSRLD